MNKAIGMEELKQIELEILKAVANFCDENNLTYYIAYGTLIGAVRHKGFIPWDDDIDIMMPRDDYNKLIEIFNTKMADSNYIAIDPYHKEAQHSFLKIGDKRTAKYEPEYRYKAGGYIDIDVFPLDGVPSDEAEFENWYGELRKNYTLFFYQRLILKTRTFRERVKVVLRRICWGGFKPKMYFYEKALKLHSKYNYNECEYVGAIECIWTGPKNKTLKEWFGKGTKVEFEGCEFNAPTNYDGVLTAIYGDYMQLPPEHERVPLHKHNTFWR